MNGYRYIVVILLVGICSLGQIHSQDTLSVEREQQFTYYWYAAKQAIEEKRFDEALVILNFCHQLNPNDGMTLCQLGMLCDALGQEERAMEHFKTAFMLDPKDQWQNYYSMLLEQRTPEGYAEALRVIEEAERYNSTNKELLAQLVWLYMSNQDWKKALKTQDKIDHLQGYDAYSALNRYRIYAQWGKNKKALEAIDTYLEQDPSNMQFLLFRLQLMEQTGARTADLYALYDKILAIDPYQLVVLNNYAYHLATHGGDLKRAERMSERTIREEPNNPVYLDTYGWILYLQGQHSLALFYLNRAAQYAVQRQAAQDGDRHHQAEENPYRGLLRHLGGTFAKSQDGTKQKQLEVWPSLFPQLLQGSKGKEPGLLRGVQPAENRGSTGGV